MADGRTIVGQPPYGRRLLNLLIDERAATGHERPYASIPKSSTVSDGFRDISYAILANAINRCARWLEREFGAPSDGDDTIVYIGPSDMRYQILSLAAVKSGHVMFFPSPRNTGAALDKLCEDAGATKIVSLPNPSSLIKGIAERRAMHHAYVSSLEALLDEAPVAPVPLDVTFEQYRFKPWVKLHTSGSTGLPKIVPIKHGHASGFDSYHLLKHNETADRYGKMRVFTPFPPFHVAGLFYSLIVMLWVDSTSVFPPPGAMVTPELVHKIQEHGRVEHSMLAPSLISDLASNHAWREGFSKLKGLTYAGGPLSDEVAGIVSQYTSVTSSLGATEYGGIPMLPKSTEDWKYFRFNEEAAGLEFRETTQPGLFELVFVRRHDPVSDLVQAIFVTFPDLNEYHTKDCLTKHPSKPGLWKYESRLDDVIVLSNGENVNPVQMEGLISSCPTISGCVIVGQGKFQTALLVERADANLSFAQVREALRPFLDRANQLCPRYGRIASHAIILTAPDKPLPRAGKGTIQRANANTLYASEIVECYARLDSIEASGSATQINLDSREKTEESLVAYLGHDMDLEVHKVRADDDFFELGMDSLQVITLTRAINVSRARKHKPEINPTFIYDHPSAEKLARALFTGARIKVYSDFDEDDEDDIKTWESMEMIFREVKPQPAASGRLNIGRNFLRSSEPPPLYQPDGGSLAWRQVLGSFLVNMSNWGLINSFGAYQAFYEVAYLQNYTPSTISWIGTVQGTLLLVVGVLSGPLFDKGYFRSTLVLAGLGLVFGLMMLSLSTQYYQIMLTQGVLIGGCSGLLYIPSVALIPLYFKRRRGLALGLATAGGSAGGVLYPIVFRRLLQEVGFGWATRVIGFLSLLTLSLAVLLLKPVGARSTRQLLDVSALLDVPYVSFAATGFFLFAGVLVPYFLVTSFGIEDVRATQDLSFYMLAILNAGQLVGRVLPAFLSDWIGPELILISAQVMAGVLGFCWIAVDRTAGYIVWLVAYGFISGMVVTLPPVVLPYICPSLAVIGTRLGMLYAVAGIGFLISTPVALALTASTNSYLGAQCWIGACCFAAAAFCTVTTTEAWKRRRLYEDNGRRHRPYLLRKGDPEKFA